MSLYLITGPAIEPITVAEARRQCRLGDSTGEPAPTAPTVALAGSGAGNCDNGAHRVGVIFVTADGETELGQLSDVVTVADKTVNGRIAVTAIPLGGSRVTARKVYLTPVGSSTAKLAATIADNTTTSTTLNIADASLGVEAPSTNTTEDPDLLLAIEAAREEAEEGTGRALITQTWDLYLDAFPCDDYIQLPKPPLASVTHLKYRDTSGTLQTWDSSNYIVSTPSGPRCSRGRISLASGITWPSTYGQADDVQIRFVCGYGAAASAVPAQLRKAMLVRAATHYLYREDLTNENLRKLPDSIDRIYARHIAHATQRWAA